MCDLPSHPQQLPTLSPGASASLHTAVEWRGKLLKNTNLTVSPLLKTFKCFLLLFSNRPNHCLGYSAFSELTLEAPGSQLTPFPIPLAQPLPFTSSSGLKPFCPRVFACLFTQNASLIPQSTPCAWVGDLRPLYPSRPCFHDRLAFLLNIPTAPSALTASV